LVAVSVDAEPEARKTVAEHALTFPVAYGAEGPTLGALTGAFWEEKRRCLQVTGFILKADGTVAQALYSTGPIGRYTAAEALKILEKIVLG
jgi:peroxiredoxin